VRAAVGNLAFILICFLCGCRPSSEMSPLPPCFNTRQPETVPVILAGEVMEDSHPFAPPQISNWSGSFVQVWKVRVAVEQVLQGNVPQRQVDIFYYPDVPAPGSVGRVYKLYKGRTELFLLLRDRDKLRPVCENTDVCTCWVRTGKHSGTDVEVTGSIGDRIYRLLLSRGDRTTDAQLIDAIYHCPPRWGEGSMLRALRKLLSSEKSTSVKAMIVHKIDWLVRSMQSQGAVVDAGRG
jgi:hypothetical protein